MLDVNAVACRNVLRRQNVVEFDIVAKAMQTRRSVRGFLPKPVDIDTISKILSVASYAPSGSNIQPWQVHVVMGKRRDELSNLLLGAFNKQEPSTREYEYYPVRWRTPYIERRRESGWGLYQTLGIKKGDRQASSEQHGMNFKFFGAPVVLIFTIDSDLEKGSWLDYGMFLQNIMVAARGCGLHTCPQAAVANYPQVIKRYLGIGEEQVVVCAISLGYEDPDCAANQFRASRVAVDDFAKFYV
ncbi:nitroreductase [Alcaligenaceae bacterium]|nr:nitroreductase [Alcaligenaceae bacterium]